MLGVLDEELEARNGVCVGDVIMPDHVDAIVWFPEEKKLSGFMQAWKRQSSFNTREWYRENAPEYFAELGEGERFWQPKYDPFEIDSRAKMEEKLKSMHEKPVRAGLVERATDGRWSSARGYAWKRTVGIPIRWIE